MSEHQLPIIVAVGVDIKTFETIDMYISKKYLLFPVDKVTSLDWIGFPQDVILFIVDTDNPLVNQKEIVLKVKETEMFQNVPIIGLSNKRHFATMDRQEQWEYHDILLMPCNMEDLLTRIEVWIKTYRCICEEDNCKSFSLDTIE